MSRAHLLHCLSALESSSNIQKLPMFTTCYNSWCSPSPSTPFRKGCSTCSNYVTLLPKLVKNFNICRHNVCEHVPMYGTWFINVIHITFAVRYSLNTNLNIILSISSIWLYAVTYLFHILPHLDGYVYWNCILTYINVFLLKSLQQCRIHRSIYDLIKSEVLSEILFYVFAGYLLDNSMNYHADATSCNVLLVLYLGINSVITQVRQYSRVLSHKPIQCIFLFFI